MSSRMRPALLTILPLSLALTAIVALGSKGASRADDAAAPPAVAPASPKTFASRDEAAQALFRAADANDDAALKAILGTTDADLLQDGKDPAVRKQRSDLAAAARARLSFDEGADGRVGLVVGTMEYPLAVPLVKEGDAWRFDPVAGRKELLARRIGEHEIEAIGICLAYADAQVEYARADRDGDGVKEYAQRILSTPGAKDGLYWDAGPGEGASPAGPELTPFKESLKGDAADHAPFNGYYWRVLDAQGANAPGGAHSYVINGNMIAGFALLAVPAVHRNTGVMTFVVSHHGKVYEKDLGPKTLEVAAVLAAFDPDPTWREVDPATLKAAAGTSPEDAPFAEKEGEKVAPAEPASFVEPANPDGKRAPSPPDCPKK